MDSPDEKKQPDGGKSKRRYLLPSGSHLMVQDGQTVDAATCWNASALARWRLGAGGGVGVVCGRSRIALI